MLKLRDPVIFRGTPLTLSHALSPSISYLMYASAFVYLGLRRLLMHFADKMRLVPEKDIYGIRIDRLD